MLLRSCVVQQFPVTGSHCAPALQAALAGGAVNRGMLSAKPLARMAAGRAMNLNWITLLAFSTNGYWPLFDAEFKPTT